MIHETIPLPSLASGFVPELHVYRFGRPGKGPKVYIQGGLHADEAPGTLVAHRLIERLADLPPTAFQGEIVLVPVANPIGLGQRILGSLIGRFALEDGRNFNRGYPDVTAESLARIEGRLGGDARANSALLRTVLRDRVRSSTASGAIAGMKQALLGLAIDADYVLDLHCDTEAVPHAYTQPTQVEPLMPLFRLLGLEIILTAEASGDHPFDEAVSGPWEAAAARFGRDVFAPAGIAVTVELRGQRDTEPAVTDRDADAILEFFRQTGIIEGERAPLPAMHPDIVPLAGCDLVPAPATGALAWKKPLGALVTKGEAIAEIVDAAANRRIAVEAATNGRLFTRTDLRQVVAGAKLGKIAGREPLREGQLLGP